MSERILGNKIEISLFLFQSSWICLQTYQSEKKNTINSYSTGHPDYILLIKFVITDMLSKFTLSLVGFLFIQQSLFLLMFIELLASGKWLKINKRKTVLETLQPCPFPPPCSRISLCNSMSVTSWSALRVLMPWLGCLRQVRHDIQQNELKFREVPISTGGIEI